MAEVFTAAQVRQESADLPHLPEYFYSHTAMDNGDKIARLSAMLDAFAARLEAEEAHAEAMRIGICDDMREDADPHERTSRCVNWRPLQS